MDGCDVSDNNKNSNTSSTLSVKGFYWEHKSSWLLKWHLYPYLFPVSAWYYCYCLYIDTGNHDKQHRTHRQQIQYKNHVDSLIDLVQIMASVNQHTMWTCQSYNIQNTVYWKSQTEIRHKQANSQAILSSVCNLKTCFVRWFRDTIEKNATGTLTAQNTMKCWS